jgi:fatty-acyl-CoA synthase
MSGYLGADNQPGLVGGWVPTGDLGFMLDGELYVTGRAKDVLIVMGHNYYPEDFEWAAGRVSGVRPGRSVAFTVDGGAEIVLVVESQGVSASPELSRHVQAAVAAAVGTAPSRVVVTIPGTLEKTTSGKLRRQQTRHRYETGGLVALEAAPSASAM